MRTFVRRTGRITSAQEAAIERLWARFGVEVPPGELPLDAIFGRAAERVVEIGFGNGDALVALAAGQPQIDFLGIEVHRPGIGHCLLAAEAADLRNLRILSHDAVELFDRQMPSESLSRVNLWFPDPWPKKRHHKRRLVQAAFLESAAAALLPGGHLCMATDWDDYAAHIDEVIAANEHFTVDERREHQGDRPLDRPSTRFERRGLALGHHITEWRLKRVR